MIKQSFTLILLLCCIAGAYAQPVITKAEKYHDKTTYFFTRINAVKNQPVSPPGMNQVWDYTWVNTSGYVEQVKYDEPLNWPRPDDDIVITVNGIPDSAFYDVTNTATYQTGRVYYESEAGQTWLVTDTFDNPRFISYHQINYGDKFNDTIDLNSSTGSYNVAYWEADAYGTVVLPADTFKNLLRVKRGVVHYDPTTSTIDTIQGAVYKWYSDNDPVPVLEIIMSIHGSPTDTFYSGRYFMFERPLSIDKVDNTIAASAHISDAQLLIKGSFNPSALYKITLLSITGQVVYDDEVYLNDGANKLPLNAQLPSANYLLRITDMKTQASSLLKLYKQ